MNKELIFDLEDLQYRLHCAVNMVWAVHSCMTDGCYSPECCFDALYGAYRYLETIDNELEKMLESEIKEGKE